MYLHLVHIIHPWSLCLTNQNKTYIVGVKIKRSKVQETIMVVAVCKPIHWNHCNNNTSFTVVNKCIETYLYVEHVFILIK